jgi:hypothetical protein
MTTAPISLDRSASPRPSPAWWAMAILASLTVAYAVAYVTGTVGVLILSLLGERAMYGYEILPAPARDSSHDAQGVRERGGRAAACLTA